jgi:hypothetical protein
MEEMIARWIRETIREREKAKENQNLYKMVEMDQLKFSLLEMRDKLLKIKNS